MKKLVDLNLKDWFIMKQSKAFIEVSINPKWTYEVINETEKAIQIKIDKPNRLDCLDPIVAKLSEWKMWIPKSAIIGNF